MKVKELIEKLKLEDEDAEVILRADEEGNYYTPLEDENNYNDRTNIYLLPEEDIHDPSVGNIRS